MFVNRKHAGNLLAKALSQYQNASETIVIGIPRGGVVPAYEIASQLNLPLDVMLVKKLGHPRNEEFAIGAVSKDEVILTSKEDFSEDYLQDEIERKRTKIAEQYESFKLKSSPEDFANKTIILVDDGVATGLTIFMTIGLLRKANVKRIIVAVPVCPADTLEQLKELADHVICLEIPYNFQAVGQHYEEFEQVEDEEVIQILHQSTQH